jgi:hypothetical protein
MSTTRRGFIGRLIAAVAAPVIPAAAVAKAPVDIPKPVKESSLSKVASDFDGDRVVVQPRFRHIVNLPIMMAPTIHVPY